MPKESTPTQRGSILLGIEARLVALFTIIAGVVALYQVFGPSPAAIPPPPVGRSEAEVEREVEKARREILEKALKEIAAARPVQTPPTAPPVAIEPSPIAGPMARTPVDKDRSTRPAPAVEAPMREPTRKSAALPKAAAPSADAARPLKPCIQVGGRIERPITVTVGSQLCPNADGIRATVQDITSYSIIYSVPGGGVTTCQRSELCTFSWESAPFFSVDVVDGPTGRRAMLVNAR